MKKSLVLALCVVIILALVPFASANWLTDLLGGSISGKVVAVPSCSDSDQGLDYYTKGTLTINGAISYTDACNSDGNLVEMLCTTGSPGYSSTIYTCPYGCSEGACNHCKTTSDCPQPMCADPEALCPGYICSNGKCVQEPVACSDIYAPVCGQPPMPACPAGMMCPQVMPAPRTYSNRCLLDAAGATFLYNGECLVTQTCVGAGQPGPNPSLGPNDPNKDRVCCSGLRMISASSVPDGDLCKDVVGAGTICSACNNGICESWENKCNCPADCGSTCTDSDGGVYPYVKGYCKDSRGVTFSDGCLNSDGSGPVPNGSYVDEQFCLTPAMREHCKLHNSADYCNSLANNCYSAPLIPASNLAWSYFDRDTALFCPNGCVNGVCIPSSGPDVVSIDYKILRFNNAQGPSDLYAYELATFLLYVRNTAGPLTLSDLQALVPSFEGVTIYGGWKGNWTINNIVISSSNYPNGLPTGTVFTYQFNGYMTGSGQKTIKGTLNGKSVSKTLNLLPDPGCYDSDKGDPFIAGWGIGPTRCTDQSNCRAYTRIADKCDSSRVLSEYYCEDGYMYWKNVSCEHGCLNGACLKSDTCVVAGGAGPNPSLGPNDPNKNKVCCDGLKLVAPAAVYTDTCAQAGLAGWGYICTNCGNGICETWESKCNCATDCASAQNPDLSDYPTMFMAGKKFDGLFVVGARAQPTDILASIDISSKLQQAGYEVPAAVLDSELPNWQSYNLITVGTPCVNSISEALMGSPAQCDESFETGKSVIKLFNVNGKLQLLVAGGSDMDTRIAARVLGAYATYPLTGMECEITGTQLDLSDVNVVCSTLTACTKDAKLCPDGTSVGRTGPNCEFAPCPSTQCTVDSDCPAIECIKAPCPSFSCVHGKCVSVTQYCTDEYAPVCGQPPMPACPEGRQCTQVMPPPRTYNNMCLLKLAGATFLYEGECGQDTNQTPPVTNCAGCILSTRCIPYGTRLASTDNIDSPVYCDISGEFTRQKQDAAKCQNSYECVSNDCSAGKCINLEKETKATQNMVQQILGWFKRLFHI